MDSQYPFLRAKTMRRYQLSNFNYHHNPLVHASPSIPTIDRVKNGHMFMIKKHNLLKPRESQKNNYPKCCHFTQVRVGLGMVGFKNPLPTRQEWDNLFFGYSLIVFWVCFYWSGFLQMTKHGLNFKSKTPEHFDFMN